MGTYVFDYCASIGIVFSPLGGGVVMARCTPQNINFFLVSFYTQRRHRFFVFLERDGPSLNRFLYFRNATEKRLFIFF